MMLLQVMHVHFYLSVPIFIPPLATVQEAERPAQMFGIILIFFMLFWFSLAVDFSWKGRGRLRKSPLCLAAHLHWVKAQIQDLLGFAEVCTSQYHSNLRNGLFPHHLKKIFLFVCTSAARRAFSCCTFCYNHLLSVADS